MKQDVEPFPATSPDSSGRHLELQPRAVNVHYVLGAAYHRLGDREAAQRHLDLAGTSAVRFPDPRLREVEDLVQAVKHDHAAIREFDNSCFSGEYVTRDITPEYLTQLERARSDKAKTEREAARPDKPRALVVI